MKKEISEQETIRPILGISKMAYESLLTEMTKRKCENLSKLIESLAAELELRRK